MNNKEAELVLECMAVDMTGALCDTKEPMRDVLKQRIEAINIAQKALRQNDAASGEPLTTEQLREMDGEPVWVEKLHRWGMVDGQDETVYVKGYGDIAIETFEDGGAYTYQPARIDREAWEPCVKCNGKCYFCIWNESSKCKKCKKHNLYSPMFNYCPHCGRPLTDEAWGALEKRKLNT